MTILIRRGKAPKKHHEFNFAWVASNYGLDAARAAFKMKSRKNPNTLVSPETLKKFSKVAPPVIQDKKGQGFIPGIGAEPKMKQHELFDNKPRNLPDKSSQSPEPELIQPDLFGQTPRELIQSINNRPKTYWAHDGYMCFKDGKRVLKSKILREHMGTKEIRYVITSWGKKYIVTADNSLIEV